MKNLFLGVFFLLTLSSLLSSCDKGFDIGRIERFSRSDHYAKANSTLPYPVNVRAITTDGLPRADAEITFTVTTGGGSIDQATVMTDENGVASVNWTIGSSGLQTLTAEAYYGNGKPIEGTPIEFTVAEPIVEGSFTDPRDNEVYPTITIGGQTWFAENLRYNTLLNWANNSLPSVYGRYYNWYTAMIACPNGWHLPTDAEWNTLEENLGCIEPFGNVISEFARGDHGDIMKSDRDWINSGNGNNLSGFNVYPAGFYAIADGVFFDAGYESRLWTATTSPVDSAEAWIRIFSADSPEVSRQKEGEKLNGRPCRCLKD